MISVGVEVTGASSIGWCGCAGSTKAEASDRRAIGNAIGELLK